MHGSGALFAACLFSASHAWLLIVRELPASRFAILSYALQQAILWGVVLTIDDRLSRRSSRFAWAAIGTMYATFTVLDALIVRMTSLPLREILPMLLASQHVIEGMSEIGLKPARLLVVLLLILVSATAGGFVRLLLDARVPEVKTRSPGRFFRVGILAILSLAFVGEQDLSRDRDDYLYRGFRMPAYVQLHSTSSRSVVVPIPPPVEHEQRSRWLAQVGPARNPRHVLYVLLESFRADAVTSEICPNMWRLSQEGLAFDAALAEATYTPLSWSVLLFDEAAHDNLFGRHPGRQEPMGSWLVAVMHQAGYTPHMYVSTNMTYAKFRDRVLTRDTRYLDFFQAAGDVGEEPADKNRNDRVAVDHMVQFVREHHWDEHPQFLLLQLDSTHYTYPFPENEAVFKPYSENLVLPRPIETEAEATLLANRYKNAAHYVDEQLGRVLDALRDAGVYDDMVVVLTGDHGEGLKPGFQGHAAVFGATRHVPLVFKLPGREHKVSHRMVSHRDILPTLTSYLGITMPDGATQGHPVDTQPPPAVLTISPSGRYAQLTTQRYVLDLSLVYGPTSVVVTPVGTESRGRAPTKEWLPMLSEFLAPRQAN